MTHVRLNGQESIDAEARFEKKILISFGMKWQNSLEERLQMSEKWQWTCSKIVKFKLNIVGSVLCASDLKGGGAIDQPKKRPEEVY